MRTLNVRLLAILLGITAVVAIGVFGINRFQRHRHAGTFLEKARELNKGDTLEQRRDAESNFVSYLRLVPDDTVARAEFGLYCADMAQAVVGYHELAVDQLERVLREDISHDEARRRLVEIYLPFRRFSDAKKHLDVLRQRKADDPEILLLLAQCQTGEKDYDGARKSYERVIEKAPGKLDAYVNLAYLIREHSEALGDVEDAAREGSTEKVANVEPSEGENPDAVPAADEKTPDEATAGHAAKHDDEAATPERKADDWMNLLVERNPETAEAYVLRGEYLRRTERLDAAEKDSAKALELMPDDKGALMLAIGLAMDKKDFDAARAHAQHAVELFAQEPDMFEVLGNIERRAGSPEKAREWIDKGLAVTGDSPQLLWSKAVLLIELGDLENARPVIDRLRESRSAYAENIRINYLEGRLALAEKEWAKARSLFESIQATVRERSPGMAREIAIYLRECYLKLNRGDLVAAMEREIRGAATTQAAMGAESIQQLLATGQIGRAIATYRELLKRDDVPPEAWIDFSKLLLVRDSRIPKEQRDFTEFQGAIDKAAELNPDRPEIPVLRANMLLVQGQPAEARDLLHEAVTKSPGQWALWEQLLLMAHSEKDWARAAELLDEAEKHIEAKASVYMARARLAVARDAEKASAEIRQLATKGDGMVDSEKVFFWNQLGGYALQARDFNLAKELYRKAADSDRSNLEIRLKLFESARLAKDAEAMKQCLDEIRGIEGEGPHWHYFSAALLSGSESDTESLEQAIDHLAKARLMRPEWAEVPMLLATIQEQMGNPAGALESYREGVRQGSRNVVGLGRFSQLLVRQNQQEEAARIIGLMKEMNVPLSPDAEYLLVVQRFREGKEEEGVAQLKEMADELRKTAATSKDYRDSARLSGVLRQLAALASQRKDEDEARKLLDEAETAIRRSVELEPENARLWMLLVAFLNQTERVGRVGDVLSEAQRKLPAAKAAITLAQCYEILGRMAEAEQQYDRAATEAKDDETLARLMATFFLRIENPEKQSKGEAILREMVDGTPPTSEADAAWARRRLALSLSQKGDHKSYLEAMKLIDANLAGDAASIPDKRIKARLLAHRPNRADRATARAIFEELVRIPDPSPSDRYELARLLFVEQEWNEASRQMQPLLAGDDIQPEWLDFYIRAQIRAGEFRDAESNLKRYERIAKDPFMVTIILARIQSGRGRHDLAIRTVKEYVDNASPTGVPRANRALNAGRALTNLAKHVTGPGRDAAIVQYLKQAEQYFREYVTKDPSQARILIGFLGEQGNREEALELAENASNADPPQPVAISAVALLSRGDPSPDEVQRVEKILDDAIKRQGEEIPLLLALAELRTIQKRYDDAEQCYRTVLDREDAKQFEIIALNNLAVFLALRGQKLDDASRLIERAIELAGSAATLLDSRATIHLAKGEWRKSLDDLTLALAEEPTGVRYFHQAQAYMQGGLEAEAAAAMKQADDYGLKVEHLQPLERPAYRQLREALQ